jgi:hypothetical protein
MTVTACSGPLAGYGKGVRLAAASLSFVGIAQASAGETAPDQQADVSVAIQR